MLASIRRLASATTSDSPRCELDSHADTCALGANFVAIESPTRFVSVHPYTDEYQPIHNIPITSCATTWVSPAGDSYILVIHEALHFGDRLGNSLLCPNQMRAFGVKVDDTPRQFDSLSSHSILVPSSHGDDLQIQLHLDGVISCFDSHAPSPTELATLPHIELTSRTTWDPTTPIFSQQEARFIDGLSLAGATISGISIDLPDDASTASVDEHSPEFFDDPNLYSRFISSVQVNDLGPPARSVAATSTGPRRSQLTAADLADRWHIGLKAAENTIRRTTQTGIRQILLPTERKLRKKAPWLRHTRLSADFYLDHLHSSLPSIHGHKGASLYTNGLGFDMVYPWTQKSTHSNTLLRFIDEVGLPAHLISDGPPEMTAGTFASLCSDYNIPQRFTVPHSPWQNKAEASIRELKRKVRTTMRRQDVPLTLWPYCLTWAADIRRFTASNIPSLDGETPFTHVMGTTPDISALALFSFFQPVYFYTPTANFPHERLELGFWLGLASACVDELSYIILPISGRPLIRKSVWAVPPDEANTDAFKTRLTQLCERIHEQFSPSNSTPSNLPLAAHDLFSDVDDELDDSGEDHNPFPELAEADDFTPESLDEYISAQVLLPHGGEETLARVTKRARDAHGRPIGTRHSNPLLDTRSYEVTFPDGSTDAFTANTIATNLYSQIDAEGCSFSVLREIVDHQQDTSITNAIPTAQGHSNGDSYHTTRGWELQVSWADGTTSWIPLKDLKESNPVEVAEYAVTNKLSNEPAFKWWVPHVLRKRNRILSKVKSRYWKRTHKYGIELPHSVKEALAIDQRTGTTFWRDAIEKEMKNVAVAFEFRDDDNVPIGYKHIDCHMIFDIKSNLARKARFVAGGHQTDPPKESTYSSVVSRDSIRIAFLIAALNDLDVLAADVQNAYLNAPTKERCYTTAGLEFGPNFVGRPVLIVRALYGLKSSGARWRDHCAATLREAGFRGCKADPDVWMRPNVKPDGFKYWEYVLCYVDDLLVISHDPKPVMAHMSSRYTLKKDSVKTPDEYLGTQIRKHRIPGSDRECWGMSSDLYIKRAIAEVEKELESSGQRLLKGAPTPLTGDYRPELDATPELDPRRANYFQGLIGVLRWMVELGRVDIHVPVALLSRHLALPREGHLEQALHVFAYLKSHSRSTMVFDDADFIVDESRFHKADWSEQYPGAAEVMPHDQPKPRGNFVSMTCFVDADHAGCRVTRRSHTGLIIFVQKAPIIWYSKRQNTVESASFGSEFIAMRTAVEQIEGLRYKLRMMGIPLEGPTNVFCDNEAVFKNSSMPESTLRRKHNAIAYHRTREAVAAGVIRIAWISGKTNIADLFTKLLNGPELKNAAKRVLW